MKWFLLLTLVTLGNLRAELEIVMESSRLVVKDTGVDQYVSPGETAAVPFDGGCLTVELSDNSPRRLTLTSTAPVVFRFLAREAHLEKGGKGVIDGDPETKELSVHWENGGMDKTGGAFDKGAVQALFMGNGGNFMHQMEAGGVRKLGDESPLPPPPGMKKIIPQESLEEKIRPEAPKFDPVDVDDTPDVPTSFEAGINVKDLALPSPPGVADALKERAKANKAAIESGTNGQVAPLVDLPDPTKIKQVVTKPTPSATPTPSPNPTITPTPTPSPNPTITPTPTPSATPKPSPTAKKEKHQSTPTPAPSPSATPTPSPTPKPAPPIIMGNKPTPLVLGGGDVDDTPVILEPPKETHDFKISIETNSDTTGTPLHVERKFDQ